MKDQGHTNQTQSTTQQKRVDLEMLKNIPNRVTYMATSWLPLVGQKTYW